MTTNVPTASPPAPMRLLRRVLVVFGAFLLLVITWYAAGRLTAPSRRVALHPPATPVSWPSVIDRPLKVLAYNIAHGRGLVSTNWAGDRKQRLAEIAALLRAKDADVVVLNEVDFDSTWSGRTNQAQVIAEAANYPWRAEQTNYDLSLPGFRIRFGNAILSRYPITKANFVQLATHSKLESISFGQKNGLICTLQLSQAQLVRVLAVHLESRSEPTRLASLPALASLLMDGGAPVILAGDFNSEMLRNTPPATALERLLLQPGLMRLDGDFGGSFPSDLPNLLIDHVLTQSPLLTRHFQVIDAQFSDHRPIMAEIKLPSPEPPDWSARP